MLYWFQFVNLDVREQNRVIKQVENGVIEIRLQTIDRDLDCWIRNNQV